MLVYALNKEIEAFKRNQSYHFPSKPAYKKKAQEIQDAVSDNQLKLPVSSKSYTLFKKRANYVYTDDVQQWNRPRVAKPKVTELRASEVPAQTIV
jgi:hypothetical protein